jgi:hypothetical protein
MFHFIGFATSDMVMINYSLKIDITLCSKVIQFTEIGTFNIFIDGFGEKGKQAHGDEGAVPPNAIQIGYEIYLFFFPFFHFSSATNRLITAKDHAYVHISIGFG